MSFLSMELPDALGRRLVAVAVLRDAERHAARPRRAHPEGRGPVLGGALARRFHAGAAHDDPCAAETLAVAAADPDADRCRGPAPDAAEQLDGHELAGGD